MAKINLTDEQRVALICYAHCVNRVNSESLRGNVEYYLHKTRNEDYMWYIEQVNADGGLTNLCDVGFVGGLELMAQPCRRMAFGMVGSDCARTIMGLMRYYHLLDSDECLAICKTFNINPEAKLEHEEIIEEIYF